MKRTIAGIALPDSAIASAASHQACAMQSESMLHHSFRAFLFAALFGDRDGVQCDLTLLYIAAMFHSVGLNPQFAHSPFRYEVDGANAARDFLLQYGVAQESIRDVWNAIALHTTPGIPEYMPALTALLAAGVQMDSRGVRFDDIDSAQRDEVVKAFPRERGFKKALIEAYARGQEQRPETTFGTVNADVLDRWDPNYRRLNFCGAVLGSDWPD